MIAKRTLKRVARRALSSPLGWRWLAPILRQPGVIVLTYHRIRAVGQPGGGQSVDTFAEQMRWLRDHCDPIAADALVERAQKPRSARPPVLVTFDDGYRDYHDLAYPVLESLAIPSVVFLATSFVDAGGMLWTDEVQWAAESTRAPRVTLPWGDGRVVELGDAAARTALGQTARTHLKQLPDAERRTQLAALVRALGDPPPKERQMLSWDEVRRTMKLTSYGGHTHTHPILSRIDADAADREIRTCKERIVAETGRAPTLFAYPNGRKSDYTDETKEILRRHGFRLAFSTSEGIAGPDSDWLAIKRLPGEAAVDLPDFGWIAAGLSRDRTT